MTDFLASQHCFHPISEQCVFAGIVCVCVWEGGGGGGGVN